MTNNLLGIQCRHIIEQYDAVKRQAWEQAKTELSALGDPVVAWIVENALDVYEEAALKVLTALPASLRDLDALADDEGWCDTWGQLRARATAELGLEKTEVER